MDMYTLLAVILITTVTATVCGSILIGTRMWLRAKTERMSLPGRGDIERLTAAMESLHEQTQFLREEVDELHERVDFAERLLTKGDAAEPSKPDPLAAT